METAPEIKLIAQFNAALAAFLAQATPASVFEIARLALQVVDTHVIDDQLSQYHINALHQDPGNLAKDADTLHEIAVDADRLYLELKAQEEPRSHWKPWFCKARLASALAIAAVGLTPFSLAAMIYELSHAHNNPEEYLERLWSAICAMNGGETRHIS